MTYADRLHRDAKRPKPKRKGRKQTPADKMLAAFRADVLARYSKMDEAPDTVLVPVNKAQAEQTRAAGIPIKQRPKPEHIVPMDRLKRILKGD